MASHTHPFGRWRQHRFRWLRWQGSNDQWCLGKHAFYCGKIFTKHGMTVSLARDADLYGSSFIFEGNRIIGKFATCKIKSRIVEEKLIHLAVDCSTVITTQPQQFTLKIIGEDRILRIFPDMPEMEVAYDRGLF